MLAFRTPQTVSITDFFEIFDELFEQPKLINDIQKNKCPIHDVIEDDDKFTIELILAGIKKDDINIDIENNVLSITGERKENKDLKYNRKETYFGKYERNFTLPNNVDKENIDASFVDGILKVIVPKIVNKKIGKKMIEIT